MERRELRPRTSPCTAGCWLMQTAVFERSWRGLAVSPGRLRVVVDRTRAGVSAELAGDQWEARRKRCSRFVQKRQVLCHLRLEHVRRESAHC